MPSRSDALLQHLPAGADGPHVRRRPAAGVRARSRVAARGTAGWCGHERIGQSPRAVVVARSTMCCESFGGPGVRRRADRVLRLGRTGRRCYRRAREAGVTRRVAACSSSSTNPGGRPDSGTSRRACSSRFADELGRRRVTRIDVRVRAPENAATPPTARTAFDVTPRW